ncbi:MAG: Bax inhibitor-1/YccA family protein [Bacteroidales bacterium]|nr:Bax inhibitor-1/YccA family protein [Bacteroidales bacterium]MDT8431825.1 Bax inhibitor-1/YccA family protein [Bacteroidales bacterium]
MRLTGSSNPAMTGSAFERAVSSVGSGVMTINGTINKIGILMLLVLASASYTWSMVTGDNPAGAQTYVMIGAIGGLIMALVTIFRPQSAGVTAPIYALLEGLFLGGISAMFNQQYNGIVFQAVLLTIGVLFTMLFLYRSGRIRATPRLRRGVIMATGAVFFSYLVSWILSLFGLGFGFMHSSGPLGIVINLVIIGVAAFNLILDFDFIEKGAQAAAPKYFEWYGAFGLLVTLIWLYIEILRLLSRFAGRD